MPQRYRVLPAQQGIRTSCARGERHAKLGAAIMLRTPGSGDGKKRCRKCGMRKTLAFFPQDRSKPDGRWHTCRACNREYSAERGKFLAIERKIRERASRPPSRTGLR